MLLPPGCKCKSGCKTKACSCRKAGPYCTSLCRCPPNKCSNRWLLLSELLVCSHRTFAMFVTDHHRIGRSQAQMWVLTQQWTRTRRTSWMRTKTAGKYLNNIRIIDHGSRCQIKVAMINCEKCVALAPTRRISCWTAPLTCLASSSSTVTLARQTTGMRVSLFNWLSLTSLVTPTMH